MRWGFGHCCLCVVVIIWNCLITIVTCSAKYNGHLTICSQLRKWSTYFKFKCLQLPTICAQHSIAIREMTLKSRICFEVFFFSFLLKLSIEIQEIHITIDICSSSLKWQETLNYMSAFVMKYLQFLSNKMY